VQVNKVGFVKNSSYFSGAGSLRVFVGINTNDHHFLLCPPTFYLFNKVFKELRAWVRILTSCLMEQAVLLIECVIQTHINTLVFTGSIA